MKWLPDPSVPSWSSHAAASRPRLEARLLSCPGQPLETLTGVLVLDALVPAARRERDRALDRLPERAAVGRQAVGDVLRADRDHAAADVDAHGGRDDGAEGRDDRPHGRAQAEVGVGHECDVRVDERQRRRRLRLLARARIEDRGPVDELRGEVLHRPFLASSDAGRRTGPVEARGRNPLAHRGFGVRRVRAGA
jgi:hypothetical protein